MVDLLEDGPRRGVRILLAHGAGAPMDSPFMNAIASGLAAARIGVARFEFEYMAKRREDGLRRGPDRTAALVARFEQALRAFGPTKNVFIGGKSMGGRIASMIADEAEVAGAICLGYPFHPPGKPSRARVAHLESQKTPTLIVQGTRDPFGTQEEVSRYPLSSSIELSWITDGNHSFEPRKRSGRTFEQNLEDALSAVVDFISRHV